MMMSVAKEFIGYLPTLVFKSVMNNLVHPLTLVAVIIIFALPRATSRIDCDFEDDQMCGYTQDEIHAFSRIAGPPDLQCTGLENDHTFSSPKGHYIYAGYQKNWHGIASIVSETYTPLSTNNCIEFWYYLRDGRSVDIELKVMIDEQGPSKRQTQHFRQTVNTICGWESGSIDVPAGTEPFQLRFIAITSYIDESIVAVDDISIKPWSCSASSYGPNLVVLDPHPVGLYAEHTPLDVLCTCENCLPACTVEWSFNDEMFQKSNRLILNVSRNTTGSYSCTCINSKSSSKMTIGFNLWVKFGPDNVILDPAFMHQASQEHSLLDVSCNCSCFPPCYVHWSLDGEYLRSGNDLQLNVSRESGGNYSCTCVNHEANKSESTNFRLTVRFGPDHAILEPALTLQTIQEHNHLNVSCNCGNCTPSCISLWYLNGVNFQNSSSLWFENVSRNSGGRYTCMCTNPTTLKSASKDFELTVNYGPDEVVLTPAATAYTVEEFSAMIPVSCNCGKCKPNCTARWISNILDVSFYDQGTLEITNVTRNSAGQYKCTCMNPYTAKIDGRQFQLTVQSKMITNASTSSSESTEAGANASTNKEMTIIASLGTGAGVCFAFSVLLLAYVVFRRKRRQHENKHRSENQTTDREGKTVRTSGLDNLPLHSIYRPSARTRLDRPAEKDPPIDYEISD